MQDFIGKKVLLGVSGGIAAYKSASLIRELTRCGAEVKVVMTESAQKFVSPLLLHALSGNEVRTDLFDVQAERAMGHIELARWADYLVIAPASANCIAKMAQGLADDLLSTVYLVAEIPLFVCPAMNLSMWAHPATQMNCALLQKRGVIFVGPEKGSQACGEQGLGRVSEVEQILSALRLHGVHQLLKDKKVILTAGPTREPIDPVRYLSNYSSGKMGYALAEAAAMAGAQVSLISGPSSLQASSRIKRIDVESAQEMLDAVIQEMQEGCIFIAAAAVADYRLQAPMTDKIKKQDQKELQLNLVKNPDILADVAKTSKASFLVGFAAETRDLLAYAKEKLHCKKLDMLVANLVGKDLGFEAEMNQVTLLTKNNQIDLPLLHKTRLAGEIIAIIARRLHNAAQENKQELS